MNITNTHIIYVTNECNINCDYCYQKEDRKVAELKPITEEYIDNFFKQEFGPTAVLVIFGGEPFMYPDLVFNIVDKANKHDTRFSISITTNGLWFKNTENIIRTKKVLDSYKDVINIEISYDGSGHDRRVDFNDKSTKSRVVNIIKEIKNYFPIVIRYTIHKDNANHLFEDTVKILKFYEGTNKLRKIMYSIHRNELEATNPDLVEITEKGNNLTQENLDKMKYLYNKFKVPLCELACGACTECSLGMSLEIIKSDVKYLTPNGTEFQHTKGTAGNFNHFTKKKENNE